MIELFVYLIVIVTILYFLHKIGTRNYDFFKKQGIAYKKPFPFIGTSYELFFSKVGVTQLVLNDYNKFSNERLYGSFDFLDPVVSFRDPELVKQIGIKDFDHFTDHINFIDSDAEELMNGLLTLMKGKRWKEMRSALSPAFTGNKMRLMCELVTVCGQQLVEYIDENNKKSKVDDKNLKSFDIKDIFSKYTNDVIASCAFGLKCDSLQNPQNEFYQIGQSFSAFQKPLMLFKFIFIRLFPKLSRLLKIQIISDKVMNKFREMIIETMDAREKHGIYRPDMINILMELKQNTNTTTPSESTTTTTHEENVVKQTWTDTELIAQCFLFFLAGFETSSALMSFIAYELAINQDIQEKLFEEVSHIKSNVMMAGEILSYDEIQKMKYMDMIISEALRKWPPAFALDRQCVRDYTYEEENGFKFTLQKGMTCFIPIFAFHKDPKYFNDPEKFDPDRFSDENKKSTMASGAYLPFGIGPRNCIGSRFALLETKILLFYIIANFKIDVSADTQIPLKLKNTVFSLTPEEPIKLRFISRVGLH